MTFAFEEFPSLMNSVKEPPSPRNHVVRYVCALMAELAYLHVPQFEIDDKKRAKVVPSAGYQEIVARGRSTDAVAYLRSRELGKSFAVVDWGIVGIGVVNHDILLIGLRGSKFRFDWKIDIDARLARVGDISRLRGPCLLSTLNGRLHRGFAEEAARIAIRIDDAIRHTNLGRIKHILLSGHSLGGAVAAISENLIKIAPISTCIFGSPRYCDVSAYISLPDGPPTAIRRPGDMVPFMPPRWMGYADHPNEFDTTGAPTIERRRNRLLDFHLLKSAVFGLTAGHPHSMELYRKELGRTAGAEGAELPLAPWEALTKKHFGSFDCP